jgi:transcriptional regulator with XRE-family HTH domain
VHIYLMSIIGENIRKLRKAKGLTQTELAEKLGTTQFVITNYERGRNNPTTAKMPEIAKALGVTLEELYGLKGAERPAEEKGSSKRREIQLQKIFSELPPVKQRAVLEHAKGLMKKSGQ